MTFAAATTLHELPSDGESATGESDATTSLGEASTPPSPEGLGEEHAQRKQRKAYRMTEGYTRSAMRGAWSDGSAPEVLLFFRKSRSTHTSRRRFATAGVQSSMSMRMPSFRWNAPAR